MLLLRRVDVRLIMPPAGCRRMASGAAHWQELTQTGLTFCSEPTPPIPWAECHEFLSVADSEHLATSVPGFVAVDIDVGTFPAAADFVRRFKRSLLASGALPPQTRSVLEGCELNCRVHRYTGKEAATVVHRDSTFLNCVFETGPGLCLVAAPPAAGSPSERATQYALITPPTPTTMTVTLGLTAAAALEFDHRGAAAGAAAAPGEVVPAAWACATPLHFAGSMAAVEARACRRFALATPPRPESPPSAAAADDDADDRTTLVFFLEPTDKDVVVAPALSAASPTTTYGDILHRNIITFPEYRHERFRPLDLRLLRRHRAKPATSAIGAFAVVDGRRVFDMSLGFGTFLWGNGPRFIKSFDFAANGLSLGWYTEDVYYCTQAIRQHARLSSTDTDGGDAGVLFCNTGSEAVSMALRMARKAHLLRRLGEGGGGEGEVAPAARHSSDRARPAAASASPADDAEADAVVIVGLGRIVASHCRSSISCQTCEHNQYLYF
jgi:hypothetical protein